MCIAAPVSAKTYTVPVWNPFKVKILGVSVAHAKIVGFKPTKAELFDLVVDLPTGKPCSVILRIRLGPENVRIEGRTNVCTGERVTVVRQ